MSGWRDNFYSNLLDFSFSNNLYAGYENKLSVQSVSNFEEDKINIIPIKGNDLTSIKHSPFDNKVALGFAKDSFKIIDL